MHGNCTSALKEWGNPAPKESLAPPHHVQSYIWTSHSGPISILTAFPDVEDSWTLRHVYRCVDGFSVSISLHCPLLSAKPAAVSMDYDASPFLLTWARSLDRQDLHPHIIIPEFVFFATVFKALLHKMRPALVPNADQISSLQIVSFHCFI
ncbi:hypothetical protein Ddc_01968 [Ditylenchus destructor]|nr:hypothetical protein Ddc_01968 [Ditylenchus destructor]